MALSVIPGFMKQLAEAERDGLLPLAFTYKGLNWIPWRFLGIRKGDRKSATRKADT